MRLTCLGPQRLRVPGASWLLVLLVLSFALRTSWGRVVWTSSAGVCAPGPPASSRPVVLGSLGPRSSPVKWKEAHLLEEREG